MPSTKTVTPLRSLLAGACLAAIATWSHAATVHVTFDNPIFAGVPAPRFDVVKITYPVPGGSQTATVAAGRFQGTASNVVGTDPSIFVDGVNDLFMYCYDLYEHVGNGWEADYTIKFDGETDRTRGFLGAVNHVLNEGKAVKDPYAWLHPTSGVMAAAIQIGIWESKYDSSGWDLASGSFRASDESNATRNQVQAFFAAIDKSQAIDPRFVMTLEAPGVQDMITGDPPPAVPEPATTWLLLTALGAAAAARRKSAARR